jgi:endonuclease YncB( thermonuclease family)
LKRRLLDLFPALSVIALIAFVLLLRCHQTSGNGPPPRTSGHGKSSSSWVRLENCVLVNQRGNDGDSFLVRHGGREFTVRLYFVDCPEKQLREENRARLEDQARYFDMTSPEAAASLGREAQAFTQHLLKHPFTVVTKWERVFDSERFYAQVIVQDARNDANDLAEQLIMHGMARLHTKGAALPGRRHEAESKRILQALESASRKEQRGGWKRL